MADSLFNNSDESNRRKQALKDKLGFKRAPLLDYELMATYKLSDYLTTELTAAFQRCTVCKSQPCQFDCPVKMAARASVSKKWKCLTLDQSQFFHLSDAALQKEVQKAQIQHCRVTEKIELDHEYQLQLINRWKNERRSNLTDKVLKDDREQSMVDVGLQGKPIRRLKSLASGAMFLLPWMPKQTTSFSRATRLNLAQNSSKQQQDSEPTPAARLPAAEWKKQTQRLEKIGDKLLLKYSRRKKREEELPHLAVPCSHQIQETFKVSEVDAANAPDTTEPIKARKTKKRQPRKITKVAPLKTLNHQKKCVRFKKGSLESEVNGHSPIISEHVLPAYHQSLANDVSIQIELVLQDNQQTFDMRDSLLQQPAELTKIVIVNQRALCEACGSIPCLNLKICPAMYTVHKSRSAHMASSFEYLFGLERVKLIRNKNKRMERNRLLASNLALVFELMACGGDGGCPACIEDRMYTRENARYRRSLMRDCFKKIIELRKDSKSRKGTSTNISLRAASKAAMAFGALKSVKVEPARAAHVGLKWDRIQYLFQTSLKSKYVEERQNAAKQLGLLGCADPEVFEALKAAIVNDTDERVQYESAKALIRLGCLEDELIQILVDYLIVGNEEVRLDMLKTLSQAKGITYINKAMPSFDELIKVLAHLCKNLNVDDPVAFDAAIAFGTICVKNMQAVEKMSHYLNHGTDTHKKAVALRILIKQFNEWSWNLVEVVLKQFTNSPVWMYRKEAAQLLQHLGRKHTCKTSEQEELVYSILERRLWDDSVEMVRMEAAHTLGVLDMYPRAAETVVRRLSDLDPTIRAHAVTSLGTLGIKQPKVLRMLTEMLELDPSDNVRREVIRAFGSLQVTDKKIIRLIKERERGEGILAAEAKQVLRVLEAL